MKRATILATVFSVFGSFGANAEPLRMMQAPPGAMPAFEAITITRSIGLDPLGGPVWRNGRYVVLATDDDGRELRVVLDAGTGQILAVRPVTANYYGPEAAYGPPPVYRPAPSYGPDYRTGEPPRQKLTVRTPANNAAQPAPAVKKPPVAQTAKVTPAAAHPAAEATKSDPTVERHEGAAKTASSSQASTTGSGAASEKKEVRKIEIDRKPAEDAPPAVAEKPSARPADVPISPLE